MGRTEVHVAADIRCYGTEVRRSDDPVRQLVMTPPAELGLSDKLSSDFRSWQWWFDGVVDLCGLEERFEYLGDKFDEVGRCLAKRVAAELGPSIRVTYFYCERFITPSGSPRRGGKLPVALYQ
jgi:hypothetical protein